MFSAEEVQNEARMIVASYRRREQIHADKRVLLNGWLLVLLVSVGWPLWMLIFLPAILKFCSFN